MTDLGQFDIDFQNLTGQTPFPWQRALYIRFLQGAFPETCELPTGLGKTSMIAIWLIALAYKPDAIPRRLVYVVNRRTVVDQTTTEVLRIRDRIAGTDWEKRLKALTSLETGQGESPLAVSTLRGALADNREWMADPARPAVIIGTVDMIGSRLLFNGYGVGFRSRPLHAGLLGQDTLLIHDEAHLEPAFQACLEAITQDQHRCNDLRKLRVIALSATTRGREGSSSPHPPFQLTPDETAPASLLPAKATEPIHVVWQRLTARKILHLHEIPDEKKLAERVVERALLFKETQRAILIFVRRVEDVGKIVTQLNNAKQHVRPLTGTQRGYERDQLAESEIFKRFLPDPSGSTISGTVYLACTSAGEVGINITADHMICDATTFDSMAQRFGRVNRFGGNPDSEIHVLHPTVIPPSEHLAAERERTLELLANLNEDASPLAISNLDPEARRRAFAPPPEILPVTDVLLDSWALSSFVHDLPGRPPVEPYLHGKEDNDEAQTQFAWRSEVTLLTGKVSQDELDDLFELVPLKPHELLRLATFGKGRAYDQLQKLANRVPQTPVWIIEPDGSLITTLTASEIVAKRGANYVVPLQSRIVILPPEAGSLTDDGTLDGTIPCDVKRDYDVYGMESENPRGRFTVTEDDDGRWWLNLTSGNRNFPIDGPIELDSTQNLDREINRAFGDLKLPAVRTKLCLDLATDDDQSHPLIR
ncbi:type I-G CRISPR-associated helicase/endonuclease Cas3g, partial [Schlesneria sp.]|uniref:type I-G CRISPR-associated helicase/endonuclease Cas3g n=1 Tax=Schlesneria sp. TaxID=2762018 RepID=UPI003F80EB2F